MLIEIHLIQNFAPSNLNRDDTNNPKDCEFGGVRRARISSQCIKRAIRQNPVFSKTTGVPVSQRTRLVVQELKKQLEALGLDAKVADIKAVEFAKYYSSKKGNLNGDQTVVLLFLSQFEIEQIANDLKEINDSDEIKKYTESFAKTMKNRPGAPDIALFGRMLADRPETNVDAACQVAHAISTHAVNMDMDFFTAVDDLQDREVTGAGMMGIAGFNSACFYRYACIDYDQLKENLRGDAVMARKTIEAFLRASALAVPTGKQNSHAAQNPPSFYMSVVRKDGSAWSLANAFEKPVYPGEAGLVNASVVAIDRYWKKLSGFFSSDAQPVVAALDGEIAFDSLKDAQVNTFEAWIQETLIKLPLE
ncbi:MAG: type I-E CRISPR-associated protein Cas7/Cse4/CasC [Anaerolineae bacterium]|nr:type I-E CRISPR-associated protein Cas7/Cse4/CasC [Anaerolineae bacterium]